MLFSVLTIRFTPFDAFSTGLRAEITDPDTPDTCEGYQITSDPRVASPARNRKDESLAPSLAMPLPSHAISSVSAGDCAVTRRGGSRNGY